MIPTRPIQRLLAIGQRAAEAIRRYVGTTTRPAETTLAGCALADVARGRSALIPENALLLIIPFGGAPSARP